MSIAVYVRVSTQRQALAQTIEQQLARLRTHIQAHGWELRDEDIFRDDGYSGATLNRPGLDRLRDAVRAAGVDRVLVTDPDRLARNYVHQRRAAGRTGAVRLSGGISGPAHEPGPPRPAAVADSRGGD